MKKYIIVTADYNDADYITKKTLITDEQIEAIRPVVEAIKNSKEDYNWGNGEGCDDSSSSPNEQYVETGILTKEQVRLFEKFLPTGEYGIHTVDSVEIMVVSEEYKIL